jgi:hypothetical protein
MATASSIPPLSGLSITANSHTQISVRLGGAACDRGREQPGAAHRSEAAGRRTKKFSEQSACVDRICITLLIACRHGTAEANSAGLPWVFRRTFARACCSFLCIHWSAKIPPDFNRRVCRPASRSTANLNHGIAVPARLRNTQKVAVTACDSRLVICGIA